MIWQIPVVCAAFVAVPAATIIRKLVRPRPQDLYVEHNRDLLRIYVKGSNPHSNAWIEHQIRHEQNLSADAGPDARYDVWRSVEVWETFLHGLSFTRSRCIVQHGETEFAVAAPANGSGRRSLAYMGGRAHGNEFVDSVQLFVDGRPRSMEDFGVYRCSELRLVAVSTIFNYGGKVTPEGRAEIPLCRKTTSWTFANGARELAQRIEFLSRPSVKMLYLAMLPIKRSGKMNDWITDKASCAPLWTPVDVAGVDATWPDSQSNHIRIWGPSGISAEVEITKGWDRPNRRSRVANRKFYNKIYFDFLGETEELSAGDVLEVAARYRIDTSV
jgi:hypothetical protein